jgi:hypothetical protein
MHSQQICLARCCMCPCLGLSAFQQDGLHVQIQQVRSPSKHGLNQHCGCGVVYCALQELL